MSETKTRAPEGARERPVDKTYEGQKHPTLTPRDAATLILVRHTGAVPEVLLGCRDAKHAFMPNRYVLPGGRVDRADAHVPVASALRPEVDAKLRLAASPTRARALAVAAIRETYEETGLLLAGPLAGKPPAAVEKCWAGFLDRGLAPALDLLDIVARAITPPGRPRPLMCSVRCGATLGPYSVRSSRPDTARMASRMASASSRRIGMRCSRRFCGSTSSPRGSPADAIW